MTRRAVINLVWFALISSLFFVWAIRTILPLDVVNRPYRIEAEFASSLGMQPGNEVALLGVKHGVVSSVRRIPGGVLVGMKIERDRRIPAGSTAHLFRKSAIGEQYVDFAPPPGYRGDKGPFLRNGDRVPMARTTVPLEFSELLRSASRLVASIPPEDLGTVVHELAVGLKDRTGSLRRLAEAGDRLSASLASRTEALDRLATNNTRLTKVLAEHRGSLGRSLGDLRQVADSLKNARGDMAVLLDRGARLLAETAALVAADKANLDCSLKVLETLVDETTTPERLAQLRTVIRDGPRAFAGVWDSRDVEPGGSWVRVGFLHNAERRAPQYVPSRELPTPVAVPPCRSALRAVAAPALRPAAARSPLDAGAGLPLALALSLVVGVAVLRQVAPVRSTG